MDRENKEIHALLSEINALEKEKARIEAELSDRKKAYKLLRFSPKTYFEKIDEEILCK